MLNKERNDRIRTGWLLFMILAGVLFVMGTFLIQDAFATNGTAIDESQSILQSELTIDNSFPVFWIIFLLILLGVFMAVMLKMREDRETIMFSISALIVSIMITLMFTSPLDFDFQESETSILITENGTHVIGTQVKSTIKQVIVIPADDSFRFALSLLFTGLTLFNGLYTIFILTNFPLNQSKPGKDKYFNVD